MLNSKRKIREKMKILRKKNFALDESAAWSASKNFFHYLSRNNLAFKKEKINLL